MNDYQINTVAVIGGGSWATALANLFSGNGYTVKWWLRNDEYVQHIKSYGHNSKYLSRVRLDLSKVYPTSDLGEAVAAADVIFLSVPSAFLTDVLNTVDHTFFTKKRMISAVKGMIPGTNLTISYYLQSLGVPAENIGVLSGPSHAEEVAAEKQTYLTVAGRNQDLVNRVAEMTACRFVKTITSEDVIGIELSAVMKNIASLACGIAHGLGYGDNFPAVLIANAANEIKIVLDTIAPGERNLLTSVYLGDLLVTAYSLFSRNRMFGNMIGKGSNVNTILSEMDMVAEGYYNVSGIYQLAQQHQLQLPVTETVYRILYGGKNPQSEFECLKEVLI